jgi:hypothetical protein
VERQGQRPAAIVKFWESSVVGVIMLSAPFASESSDVVVVMDANEAIEGSDTSLRQGECEQR